MKTLIDLFLTIILGGIALFFVIMAAIVIITVIDAIIHKD